MIHGTLLNETDKAVLFKPDGLEVTAKQWVPRSTCTRISRQTAGTPTQGTLHIEGWMVKKLGWEDYDE